jgi:hypothetical protein
MKIISSYSTEYTNKEQNLSTLYSLLFKMKTLMYKLHVGILIHLLYVTLGPDKLTSAFVSYWRPIRPMGKLIHVLAASAALRTFRLGGRERGRMVAGSRLWLYRWSPTPPPLQPVSEKSTTCMEGCGNNTKNN